MTEDSISVQNMVLLKKGIETNATVSVPSPVRNLAELDSTINVQRLISSIGWEYLRTTPLTQQDGGWGLVSRQRGFQMINPTDEWFPGLDKIRDEFQSWDWKFGRTPKFHITRSFLLPQSIQVAGRGGDVQQEELRVTVTVAKGLVEDVIMRIPPSLMMSETFIEDIKVMSTIRGRRFTEDALDELNASFGTSHSLREDGKQFVADCMRKVMASV